MSGNLNGVNNSDRKRKAGEVKVPPRGQKTQKVATSSVAPNDSLVKSVSETIARRQAVEAYEKEKKELKSFLDKPQGRDAPSSLSGRWNSKKDTYVVVHKKGNEHNPAEFQLLAGAKSHLNNQSGAPSIQISKDGYKLQIRSENVKPGPTGDSKFTVFDYRELDFEDAEDKKLCDPALFSALIRAEHRMGTYDNEAEILELIEFGLGNNIKKKREGPKEKLTDFMKPSEPTEPTKVAENVHLPESRQASMDPKVEKEGITNVAPINSSMVLEPVPSEPVDTTMANNDEVEVSKSTVIPADTSKEVGSAEATDTTQGADQTETSKPKKKAIKKAADEKAAQKKAADKKAADKKNRRKGLTLISFDTRGKFWFDEKKKDSEEMESLLKKLKSGECSILVVRDFEAHKTLASECWIERMEIAVANGVWSYYNDAIGKREGNLFEAWKSAPNKPMRRQFWMQMITLKKEHGKLKKFASHPAKKTFGSARELEIVHSLALLYETVYENALIDEYFTYGTIHNATVKEANNGYVVIHVEVEKRNLAMPPIGADTKFGIKKVTWTNPPQQPTTESQLLYSSRDDRLTQEHEDDEPEAPQDKGNLQLGPPCKGHSVDVDTEVDFVLSFSVPKHQRGKWRLDDEVEVALEMERNPIPSMRQFKAIGAVSRLLKETRGKKRGDPKSAFFMQDFLLGVGNPEFDDNQTTLAQENFKVMTEEQRQVFKDYVKSLNLNERQKLLFDTVFNSRRFMTQMQGPPGTGKTHTTTGLAMAFTLLGLKTALCAPTNVAVQACVDNVLEAMKELPKLDEKINERLKVVIIPNSANLKASLANLGEIITAYDMMHSNSEKEEYKHSLLNHVLRSFQGRAQTKSGDWVQAEKWLAVKEKMQKKQAVSSEDLKSFVQMVIEESSRVLKDPNVKLVMSTSSNADIIKDYGYKPMALVHDESAFSVEPETMIPLSLGARFNVLVGDHLQLRPIVRSRGYNEYANQRGMSAYERFYGHHNVPLIRLNVNYRMHPDIAELPGLITYEWLGCDESTKVESEEYKYFHDWLHSSNTDTRWSNARKPEFGGKADPNDRVRWMNVIGGLASPKAGGTSYRNFANIQAAIDFVMSLLKHGNSGYASAGIISLDELKITVLSPYKDDCSEMSRQLRWAIKWEFGFTTPLPQVTVVDKIQGGQNEIVLLLFPPHHCNVLGFLKQWNRLNVAMTRAKSVLYIFGNYDALRDQLNLLVDMGCKKLALTLIDYADKGRIVDLLGHTHRLPGGPHEEDWEIEDWSLLQNGCPSHLTKLSDEQLTVSSRVTEASKRKLETQLLKELQALRAKAAEFQREFDLNGHVDTTLEFKLPGEGEVGAADPGMNDASLVTTHVDPSAETDDSLLAKAIDESLKIKQPGISRADENGDDAEARSQIEVAKNKSLATNELLDEITISSSIEKFKAEYWESMGDPLREDITEAARKYIVKSLQRNGEDVPEYLMETVEADDNDVFEHPGDSNEDDGDDDDDLGEEDIDDIAEGHCKSLQGQRNLPRGPPYSYEIRRAAADIMLVDYRAEDFPAWLTEPDEEMNDAPADGEEEQTSDMET